MYRIAIVALAFAALLLLVASGAETNNLIPLFAMGCSSASPCARWGWLRHWRRERGSHWRLRVGVNGAGRR